MRLNLNADLGESYGAFTMGNDPAMLDLVDSANLACGMHGGDPLTIARTIRAAVARGVSLGAHPSYADLQGFGRRAMNLPAEEIAALVTYQIGALQGLARAQGARVSHVKPHGALNNQACADPVLAGVLAEAIALLDPDLILLAPALSALAVAGEQAGLRVALEIFADRSYTETGELTPRSLPGAVLHQPEAAVAHVRGMIRAGGIVTSAGQVLPTAFHSICVHGDGAAAVETARQLRQALQADGVELVGLPDLRSV